MDTNPKLVRKDLDRRESLHFLRSENPMQFSPIAYVTRTGVVYSFYCPSNCMGIPPLFTV